MARIPRGPRRLSSCRFRWAPHRSDFLPQEPMESEGQPRRQSRPIQEKDWEDATCSVCMECPHSAVLLLCSSHDKGCRPYMCGTSYRYSNCLDQYMKAYAKGPTASGGAHESGGAAKLACPLCRGQVKGWTVVEAAREHLNSKKRSCVQEDCSFAGTYKELRKHMRAEHPSAKPQEVDPVLEENWRSLEHEREHEDVMSVIRSSTPGAVVWGDYVIEGGGGGGGGHAHEGDDDDDDDDDAGRGDGSGSVGRGARGLAPNVLNFLVLLRAFENSRSAGFASHLRSNGAGSGASQGGGSDEEGPVIRLGRSMRRSDRRRRRSSGHRGMSLIDEDVT